MVPSPHLAAQGCSLILLLSACTQQPLTLPPHDATAPNTVYSVSKTASLTRDDAVDAGGKWIAWVDGDPGAQAGYHLTLSKISSDDSGGALSLDIDGDVVGFEQQFLFWFAPGIYFSPNADLVATAFPVQWTAVGRSLTAIEVPGKNLCYAPAMSFSRDGTKLAGACSGDSLRVWNMSDKQGMPTDTALPEGTMSSQKYSAAALAPGVGGAWNLALAGRGVPLDILVIDDAAAKASNIASLALPALDVPRVAFSPQVIDQLIYVGSGSSGLVANLISGITSKATATLLETPEYALQALTAQFSPDGQYVLSNIDFLSFDKIYLNQEWTQNILWRLSDGAIVLRTSDQTERFFSNSMTSDGRVFGWAPTGAAMNAASWLP